MEIACHAFVSPELGEREPARHFHGVLVLRGNGEAAKTASHTVAIPIVSMLLRFITAPPVSSGVPVRFACFLQERMKPDARGRIYQTKVSTTPSYRSKANPIPKSDRRVRCERASSGAPLSKLGSRRAESCRRSLTSFVSVVASPEKRLPWAFRTAG